jgi:DNA-binding response OmpR family regulator
MEPKQQKIVIVEDNEALAEIYKTRLEMLKYTCYTAYDGITALYLIRTEKPQLVLLDLMVPNIAGDEILKRMRSSDWGKDIPVFIISNLNETDAPAGLREMNIVGYVVKANLAEDGLDKIVNSILRPDNENPQPAPPDAYVVTPPVTLPPVSPASPVATPPVAPSPGNTLPATTPQVATAPDTTQAQIIPPPPETPNNPTV